MGKKGGGGMPANTTQTTIAELPDYAMPYYDQVMSASSAALDQSLGWDPMAGEIDEFTGEPLGAYVPGAGGPPVYMEGRPNARLAGLSPELLAAQQAKVEMFENPNREYEQWANEQMNYASGQNRAMEGVTSGGSFYDLDPSGVSYAEKYMNPYNQMVTQTATRAATTDYEKQRDRRAATMAAAGGRGGYRDTVMDAIGQASLAGEIGDITGKFGQEGYYNAQDQFERDRQAEMSAVNQRNAMRQAAAGSASGLATQGRQFGDQDFGRRLQELGLMESAGYESMAADQRQKDIMYSDWMNEQNYLQNQLNAQMGLLQGVPMGTNQIQQTYSGQPGFAQQLAGLAFGTSGLADLGLFNK